MSLLLEQNNPNEPSSSGNTGSSTVQQNNGVPVLPGSTSGAQGAATTSGGPQATTQAPGSAPSSPWNNINSYLSNNQPQAAAMGTTAAQNIQDQYSNIGNQIATTNQNFQNAVSSASVPENTSLINEVATNPIEAAATPSNIPAFVAQTGDVYQGPTDFTQYASPTNTTGNTDWANINNAINANAQTYENVANPASTQTLAQGIEGNQINPGITNLDTILLNQNPDSIKAIESAAGNWGNLNTLLNNAQAASNPLATQAEATAQSANKDANAALQAQEQALNTTLNNELTSAAATATSVGNNYSNLFNQFNQPLTSLPQTTLLNNGINPDIVNAIADIGNYNGNNGAENMPVPNGTTFLPSAPNSVLPTSVGQVATADDVALSNALAALSGGNFAAPVTAPGTYTASSTTKPTINQASLANSLYDELTNNEPTFTKASDANAALKEYQDALNQLTTYLGIPTTQNPNPPPPVVAPQPPPVNTGGGVGLGGGLGGV